jgi:hypothetical protein
VCDVEGLELRSFDQKARVSCFCKKAGYLSIVQHVALHTSRVETGDGLGECLMKKSNQAGDIP